LLNFQQSALESCLKWYISPMETWTSTTMQCCLENNWKWLSVVQPLASEGCPIEFVLAGFQCGESFTSLVCTVFTSRLFRLYKQLITLHVCYFATGSRETQLHTKILFTDEATFNGDGMTNARNSHVWSLDNSHASTETNFQSRFRLAFGAVLLEANSLGRLYLKSAWHPSAISVSRKMSCQCF
jgi:hypothetical protein